MSASFPPKIRPYKISVPSTSIDLLKQKLALTRFPDELDDAAWDYGAPLADIKRLAGFWQDGFDWRGVEEQLNKDLPQFEMTVEVEGFGELDVHFVHQRGGIEGAVPVCFVHGWPGSFLEVKKLLPLLAESEKNGGPAFHVVAPSLPNFGFSEGVKKRGFGLPQYAEVCHKVMLALGYEQYATQGGDWGSLITRQLSSLHPSSHRASHVNMFVPSPPTWRQPLHLLTSLTSYFLSLYTPREHADLRNTISYLTTDSFYLHLQRTKPQTLGYGLTDSPVGLLAWIYEKLVSWTDEYGWTDEEVLTWVSVYWFSRAGPAASLRIYYEALREGFSTENPVYPRTHKLGIAYFPREVFAFPRSWARREANVVYQRDHDSGGHFAAWERPEDVVGDLRVMFGKGGPAYGAVTGRPGHA
jgi:pimeloyl-ACP methyl ester carboxylesterase